MLSGLEPFELRLALTGPRDRASVGRALIPDCCESDRPQPSLSLLDSSARLASFTVSASLWNTLPIGSSGSSSSSSSSSSM